MAYIIRYSQLESNNMAYQKGRTIIDVLFKEYEENIKANESTEPIPTFLYVIVSTFPYLSELQISIDCNLLLARLKNANIGDNYMYAFLPRLIMWGTTQQHQVNDWCNIIRSTRLPMFSNKFACYAHLSALIYDSTYLLFINDHIDGRNIERFLFYKLESKKKQLEEYIVPGMCVNSLNENSIDTNKITESISDLVHTVNDLRDDVGRIKEMLGQGCQNGRTGMTKVEQLILSQNEVLMNIIQTKYIEQAKITTRLQQEVNILGMLLRDRINYSGRVGCLVCGMSKDEFIISPCLHSYVCKQCFNLRLDLPPREPISCLTCTKTFGI